MLAFFSQALCAQNNPQTSLMINPYDLSTVPYNSSGEFFYNDNSGLTTSGFNGEYLIKIPLEWHSASNPNFSFYYRIENVSFPFIPDCYNNCLLTTIRNFTTGGILDEYSSPYAAFGSTGLAWDGDFAQKTPLFPFEADDVSMPASLNSYAYNFNGFFNPQRLIERTPLPHSVLKHTVYLYCNETQTCFDSLSWIYDNTRGTMKNYPFGDNIDNCGGSIGCYDLIFLPQFLHHGVNGTYNVSEYTHSDNASWYCFDQNPVNCSGTIDFFPIDESFEHENTNFSCDQGCEPLFVPLNFDGGFPPTSLCEYFHPAPYTILWGHLLNYQMNSLPGHEGGIPMNEGIEHEYNVGSFDITQINPSEREFYNPSEVSITSPLTFPCGYIFRTAYGRQPERSDVEQYQSNHWNLYPDIRKIPASIRTDEQRSVYHVYSTLTIEPWVKILDADFYIYPGGEIIYDPAKITGNYDFDDSFGGLIIHQDMHDCDCKSKCFEPLFYDTYNVHIDQNTIWEYKNYIIDGQNLQKDELIIANTIFVAKGCTLIIRNNAVLKFGHQGGIVVQPGGHLIIENATLTSACEMLWKGIMLKKQMLLSPNIPPNEFLATVTISNSTIENSYIGIYSATKLAKTNYPAGRVVAENSTFRNNYISILLEDERINAPITVQRLKAHNCVFETTNRLYENIHIRKSEDKQTAHAHIKAENSNRIQLRNNHFSCNTAVFKPHERPTGIFSYNSSFVTYQAYPNTFDGLREGIWAAHTGTPDYIRIDGMTFDNCIHSVVLEGTVNSYVLHSTFNVPASEELDEYSGFDLFRGYNKPVGLYMRECNGIKAEENTFNGINSSNDPDFASFGIVANSIGSNLALIEYLHNYFPNDNYVEYENYIGNLYLNSFDNFSISIQSEFLNGGYNLPPSIGLSIRCNEIANSQLSGINICGYYRPSQVGSPQLIEIPGYLKHQGQASIPASNNFINNPIDIYFANEAHNYTGFPLHYYYTMALGSSFYPSTNNDNKIVRHLISMPVGCVVPNNDFFIIEDIVQEINLISTNLRNAQMNYQSTVDAGDTELLLNTLYSSAPPAHKRRQMLQVSPFLSDTVLKAAINPSSGLPPGHIQQIVNANSPVSANVLKYIENRELPLPQGTLNNIYSNQTGISERALLEDEIAGLMFELDMLYADLIRAGIEYGIMDSVAEIIEISDTLSPIRRQRQFDVFLLTQQYDRADSLLQLIRDSSAVLIEYELSLKEMNLIAQRDTLSVEELATAYLQFFENEIITSPEAAFKGKAFVHQAKGKKYKREPYAENGFQLYSMPYTPENEANEEYIIEEPFLATIYPNPATDVLNIESNMEIANICIYNTLGVEIYKAQCKDNSTTLSVKHFPEGVYFVRVENRDGHFVVNTFIKN